MALLDMIQTPLLPSPLAKQQLRLSEFFHSDTIPQRLSLPPFNSHKEAEWSTRISLVTSVNDDLKYLKSVRAHSRFR